MAIITSRRADSYVIVPRTSAEDPNTSFEAKGMHSFLLAKPRNWQVNVNALARAGRIGREKVYRILGELISAGYAERVMHRKTNGQVREIEYLIYSEPQPLPEKPEAAKQEAANPLPANPTAYIRTQRQQELRETTTTQQSLLAPLDEFETWWSGYPEKVGKGAARRAFDQALRKASFEVLVAGVNRYKASKPADRAWCHPATWLNQERWLDQPADKPSSGTLGDWSLDRLREMGGEHVVDHQH